MRPLLGKKKIVVVSSSVQVHGGSQPSSAKQNTRASHILHLRLSKCCSSWNHPLLPYNKRRINNSKIYLHLLGRVLPNQLCQAHQTPPSTCCNQRELASLHGGTLTCYNFTLSDWNEPCKKDQSVFAKQPQPSSELFFVNP
jgi:hypothetical protein